MEILRSFMKICECPEDSDEGLWSDSSDRLDACLEQILFYLSPSNLDEDSVVRDLVCANPDGYVPVSKFLRLERIKPFHLSRDSILDACASSDLLEVDYKRGCIRTKLPYTRDSRRDQRTIHVKGLYRGETLERFKKIIVRAFGDVNNVFLHHYNDQLVADVEFSNEEDALAAVSIGIPYHKTVLQPILIKDMRKIESKIRKRRP